MIEGKIGDVQLEWVTIPRGPSGEAHVKVNGKLQTVRWKRDRNGLWLETDRGAFGFDILGSNHDEGGLQFEVNERGTDQTWSGLRFVRKGEDQAQAGGGAKKKAQRVRAEMPGKIVKILVAEGERVEKGQPLLVMEAMKMENEIRALETGLVKKINVTVGQAVETGADLVALGEA